MPAVPPPAEGPFAPTPPVPDVEFRPRKPPLDTFWLLPPVLLPPPPPAAPPAAPPPPVPFEPLPPPPGPAVVPEAEKSNVAPAPTFTLLPMIRLIAAFDPLFVTLTTSDGLMLRSPAMTNVATPPLIPEKVTVPDPAPRPEIVPAPTLMVAAVAVCDPLSIGGAHAKAAANKRREACFQLISVPF